MQVVEQGRDGSIGGRKELVSQVRKGLAVRVPSFVVSQVHLHEADSRLDKAAGHQQRPAERIRPYRS